MDISRSELKEMLEEVIEERTILSAEEHEAHHRWIEERIEAEKARKTMYMEMAKSAAQWSVAGILGAIWYYIKPYINQ